jgi:catalase
MRINRLLAVLAALAITSPGLARADDEPVEAQIVDALNKVFGTHPGFRANHAKGTVVEGSFKASPGAAALSKAVLFNGSTIPATVRFSDPTGIPDLPDGAALANPHGMAIKYHLPDGSDTDMVIVALKFFPVATGEEFCDLLLAVAASPPDAAKRPPNFLMDELPQRLKRGPVTFHLKAQLAAPGDQTRDPTQPWPADRKVVELGVLTIDKAVANSEEAQKTLLFLPGQLIPGIEPSDDPLIDVRDGAYAVSFSRRNP